MGASVVVRNDGPDPCEVRIGKQSKLLYAGQEFRLSTQAVEICALPKMSQADLALHMGARSENAQEPARYVDGQ